jgi:hypothetical protein
MSPDRNLKDGTTWYLLNGDTYSNTTACHVSKTWHYFQAEPRISYSAAMSAGLINGTSVSLYLVDFTKDDSKTAVRGEAAFNTFEKDAPAGSTFSYERDNDGNITTKTYHRVGTVLLQTDDRKWSYLCAMDESSYFISLLKKNPKSVEDAYKSLMPSIVSKALANGVKVIRQGEWYFMPVVQLESSNTIHFGNMPTFTWNNMKTSNPLPAGSGSNLHLPTRYSTWNKYHFAMGMVRHVDPATYQSTGQHRAVKLGKTLHLAVENEAVQSWSADGRVD